MRLSDKTASAENWSSKGNNWEDIEDSISEWAEVTPNRSDIASIYAVWEIVRDLRGLSWVKTRPRWTEGSGQWVSWKTWESCFRTQSLSLEPLVQATKRLSTLVER